MSKLIKIFSLTSCCILIFAFGIVIFAQENQGENTTEVAVTEAVNLDEDIQPADLGISEPKLLPDSPFYFLKNWSRSVQSFFTFNPVKKAELTMKFTNERLMEMKKLVEKTKSPEIIKKAAENYQKEVGKIKERVEKIKQKAEENPQVESFLDKFIDQQTLHQKLLQKLETQVPAETFEKIKEAREEHLERFKDVMLKLEERKEVITKKLGEVLEKQKGSEFKDFKNLEVLKNLEEKVPEEAKEAIQKSQENALKRLQGNLEKMSSENQEKFKEYIEKISGEKEKQLEILENLKLEIKATPEAPKINELKEKLEEGGVKILEKTEKRETTEKIEKPSKIEYKTFTDEKFSVDYPSLWEKIQNIQGIMGGAEIAYRKGESPDICGEWVERYDYDEASFRMFDLEIYKGEVKSFIDYLSSNIISSKSETIEDKEGKKYVLTYDFVDTLNIKGKFWATVFNCGDFTYLVCLECAGNEAVKDQSEIVNHIIDSIRCQE